MAHNLSVVDGKVEMFYTGETPWHKLGTKLDNPATAREAIEAAHLDWVVKPEEVYYMVDGIPEPIPDSRVIVRQDTRVPLGVTGIRYTPIQNVDAFGFFDNVVGQSQAIYHTAGALGKGERIWIMAKLPEPIRIKGTDDVTEKFLLLTNSHNGKDSLRAFFTPVRVVCQNTLYAALSEGGKGGVSIRHVGDIQSKVKEAQEILGLAVKYYDSLSDVYNKFASTPVTSAQVQAYLNLLVPNPEDGKNSTRSENTRKEIEALFESGKGNNAPGVRGTVWALLNGVSEYVTHNRSTRGTDETRDNNKLASLWFGSGRDLNQKAFEGALELAGIGN